MTDRKIGPFQLDRQIGVGGMGIVYSALYPKNGKTVAVKVLAPGLMSDAKVLKRFQREMEILKRLNHPNIVKYHGGGADGDRRYYVMEYIDGGSLLDVLNKRDRLTWDKAIQVGRQVSSALEHAHNAGIIHRDLKPANLFLTRKGRLKLGDFGIARDTEATALTAAGKTVGTYAYMAPEQIQAGPAISRKTDLYALGCLLYEVIVGETPFQSENPMDMLMQHLKDAPYNVCEKVPDCPIPLDVLIEELLAKDPDDRPYDALAVHTRLGEIRDQMTTEGQASIANTVIGQGMLPKGGKATKSAADGGAEKNDQVEKPKKKKKKKKRKTSGPFHEQTWFLVTCLLVLVGATAWFMHRGEDWYVDRWRTGMAGDSFAQREARDKADLYLEKFPDGSYLTEAKDVSDTVNSLTMEEQLSTLARRPRDGVPPFKEACSKVVKQEYDEGLSYKSAWDEGEEKPLEGNPLRIMQAWRALSHRSEKLDKTDNETRWLLELCETHHDYFREKLLASPKAEEYLRERMLEAEELAAKGDSKVLAIWQYVLNEFARVERFKEFHNYARQRNDSEPASVPEVPRQESIAEESSE